MTRERWRTPASTFEHVLHPSTRRTYQGGLPELGDHSDSRGGEQPGQRLDCSRLVVTPAETTSTPAAGTSSSRDGRSHATVSLLQGWISTPSWNTSQAFLAGHPALHGPEAVLALEKWSGDAVARPYLAILRLTEHVPAGDVFDVIIDPTDAHQLLLRVAHRQRTRHRSLVRNSTHCCRPVRHNLTAALIQALRDQADYPDEIDQALRTLAEAASTSERRDTLTLPITNSYADYCRLHR
jgi:hypothetical protein